MTKKDNQIINETKFLALDMIAEANQGYQGIAIDLAPILHVLFSKIINFDPKNPEWINRDRLIVSSGHGASILYSYLHFAGYDWSLNDLKNYGKMNSKAPGLLEYNVKFGVETNSLNTASGIGNAVGIALAERYYRELIRKNSPKRKIIDHFTYCVCGEEDLMDGASYESLSFAGVQKLNKLVILYNANNISVDGPLDNVYKDNIHDRFESIGFDVFETKRSNLNAIYENILAAKKSKKPSIVIIKGPIGEKTPYQNDHKIFLNPLTKNMIKELKEASGVKTEAFSPNIDLVNSFQKNINARINKVLKKWNIETEAMSAENNSKVNEIYNYLSNLNLNIDLENIDFKIDSNYEEELVKSNQQIMNIVASKSKFIVGGSSGLQTICRTFITKSGTITNESPCEKNIAFGFRKNAMGDILNGLSLSGLKTYGSSTINSNTSFISSITNSALMNLPVTYIFTEADKFENSGINEKLSINHLSSLRLIPELYTFRPADINEIIGVWDFCLKSRASISMVLSKIKTKKHIHTNSKYVKYGAYMVRKEKDKLDAVLVATGTEVAIALEVAKELFTEGIDIRVVSMPCFELFLKQHPKYESQLLPKCTKIFTIEASSSLLWNRFASGSEYVIGIDKYPVIDYETNLRNYYGFTKEKIKEKIKKQLLVKEEFLF